MEETGKIDYKLKIRNPIEADKDPLDVHQEIVLAMKIPLMIVTATFYPIKVLPMNLLTPKIQIKLRLIMKLYSK